MKRLFNVASHYRQIKGFYLRHERWLMPTTLVVGFLVDYVTFANIQIKITFALLSVYWLASGATIIFINLYDANQLSKRLKYVRLFAPLLIQFTFGALLGSAFVFYWMAGSFSVSWPIIMIIALLMVLNDIFRHYFLKPLIQISVYFFATASLLSLILPFAFRSLSQWLFLLAIVSSLAVFCPFIIFLSLSAKQIYRQKKHLFASVFAIAILMNVLYLANIIPPIPLSLREAGLYHSLKNSDGKYLMLGEREDFRQKLIPGQTIHIKPGERMYLYTAVFSPAQTKTQIFHHWQHYDEKKNRWTDQGRLSFAIAGGRKEGYKGYSFKSSLTPGKWRIYVKNQKGQTLGKVKFFAKETEQDIELKEVIR